MAKKNDNTLKIIGIGILAYVLLSRNQQPPYQNYPNIPPAPPQNTPAWEAWVTSIINIYGEAAQLWMPGGPFYKGNKEDVNNTAQGSLPPGSSPWGYV